MAATLLVASSCLGARERLAQNALPEPHTRQQFRVLMPYRVRADHPEIRPVAEAIRAITLDPLKQLVMVNDVSHLLVDFDDDERVYGEYEYHATLDEMIENRRRHGWVYLRDDCDGRSVFAAHLLAALGIPYRLEASYWKRHAWVVATVGGVDYDLLDLAGGEPETQRTSYRLIGRHLVRPSNPPPAFHWRRAWAEKTGRNLELGWRLGLLTLDSSAKDLRHRYSTDWVKLSPASEKSPFDERTRTAPCAGFPFGEMLVSGRGTPAEYDRKPSVSAPAGAVAAAGYPE